MKINRREAVVGMTTALVSPVAASMGKQPAFANDVFVHGVASGDPAADSVVLWTRVSGQSGTVTVEWVVAADPELSDVIAQGRATTSSISDYTVKVVPEGLPAGAVLYYGFSAAGTASPTGRTRTLPTGSLEQLVIAVTSCSNFPFGRFNGYQAIADDPEVDVVVHLGDYIYEYSADGYGAADGRRLGREHQPAHEIVTLSDYRTRHAQYKRDPGSLAMHAMHPLIPTWDDHESTNNPWFGGAQNHQEGEGDWLDRRSVSLRAYYEWMPVREPGPGEPPEQRRAHFSFGDLASLYMVETRHMARAEQVDFADHEAALETPEDAATFYKDVVGDASRRMITSADAEFLRDGLAESVAGGQRWRVLANQIILAKVVAPDLDDEIFASALSIDNDYAKRLYAGMAQLGEVGLPFNMDAWDGYPAARERLYNMLSEVGARDLLAVTGDTHVFWQNRLVDSSGASVGLELGTSGITSPSGFQGFGKAAAARLDKLIAAHNDSVEWIEGGQRGFVRLTLRRETARAEFVALSTIDTRNFKTQVVRSVDIVRRDGTLDYG